MPAILAASRWDGMTLRLVMDVPPRPKLLCCAARLAMGGCGWADPRAAELNPLTISQSARTISWTPIGIARITYDVTGLWLNTASRQAAIIRKSAAIPQPDSQRGIRFDR